MEGEDPQDHLTWITCQPYKAQKLFLAQWNLQVSLLTFPFFVLLHSGILWDVFLFLLLDLTSFTFNVTKRFYIGALSDEDS